METRNTATTASRFGKLSGVPVDCELSKNRTGRLVNLGQFVETPSNACSDEPREPNTPFIEEYSLNHKDEALDNFGNTSLIKGQRAL